MKSCVIVFPASNCDRDAAVALKQVSGADPQMVWHAETSVPDTDLIVLPGGFSYGDYLRAGAMAARSPIMRDVIEKAKNGVPVLGVCNGFQILCETGLLPGALLRNKNLTFACETVTLKVENAQSMFTSAFQKGQYVEFPIAHHDGNYFADDDTLDRLEGDGRIAFRYIGNPNGSSRDIAGVISDAGNVLGMMPHPERAISPILGGVDGAAFFKGVLEAGAKAA
ncbi:MAG: phosphoribosylformylglycinamidine synthase subunit PurQ [Pseudomonadota bacterium]